MSAAAVIILRRKKFIRRFREQGATSPDRAIPFQKIGMRRSWVFNQMTHRGVFARVEDGRYHLNEQVAQTFLAEQRRRALISAAVLLVVFVLVLLASAKW